MSQALSPKIDFPEILQIPLIPPLDHAPPSQTELLKIAATPYLSEISSTATNIHDFVDYLTSKMMGAERDQFRVPYPLLKSVVLPLHKITAEETVKKFLKDHDLVDDTAPDHYQPHIAIPSKDGKSVELIFAAADLKNSTTLPRQRTQATVRHIPQMSLYENEVQAAATLRALEKAMGISFGEGQFRELMRQFQNQIRLAEIKQNCITLETGTIPFNPANPNSSQIVIQPDRIEIMPSSVAGNLIGAALVDQLSEKGWKISEAEQKGLQENLEWRASTELLKLIKNQNIDNGLNAVDDNEKIQQLKNQEALIREIKRIQESDLLRAEMLRALAEYQKMREQELEARRKQEEELQLRNQKPDPAIFETILEGILGRYYKSAKRPVANLGSDAVLQTPQSAFPIMPTALLGPKAAPAPSYVS